MADNKTLGLVIASVAVIAAATIIAVSMNNKKAPEITVVNRSRPSSWYNPWSWGPMYGGGGRSRGGRDEHRGGHGGH